jgi:hypothetical protein
VHRALEQLADAALRPRRRARHGRIRCSTSSPSCAARASRRRCWRPCRRHRHRDPATENRSPFPLRAAGSFDGPLIEQAVSVSPFREDGETFCLVEIRDVSGTVERERACSTTPNRCAPVPTSTA